MPELLRPPHEEPQPVIDNREPAPLPPSYESGKTDSLPRLRRVARYIGTRLRFGRTPSSETADSAYDTFNDGVDEFGLPTVPAAQASYEYAHDTLPRRTGEFVKRAPRFLEQVNDTSRTNPIEYMSRTAMAVGTQTEGRETAVVSEHDTLVGLRDFFSQATEYTNASGEHPLAPLAQSMTENLTFIGERDYTEAAAWFAENWRQRLQSDPTKQLCISTAIAESDNSTIKSSTYLLDTIMKHFSDEELAEWKGRLIMDPSELTAEPKDASIILLDDWTISGAQLKHSAQSIIDAYPDYQKQIEVQLVAASEKRIQEGLKLEDEYGKFEPIPINAYYAAHAANEEMASHSGAHITGAHCAVDYDFNDQISRMAITMSTFMPPGTNIVRPYRKPGYMPTRLQRWRQLNSKSTVTATV